MREIISEGGFILSGEKSAVCERNLVCGEHGAKLKRPALSRAVLITEEDVEPIDEDKSKRAAHGGKTDSAAAGRVCRRIFPNDYFNRDGAVQSLSHAGIPDCQGVRRQRGRIVLSGREPDGGGWKKMNENCLMGKEYIELRSSLDALCRSFIENKETIRDTFPWDSVYLYPVCGAVFTDKRRRADGEQLKYCRDLLRDETGVFSSFRGLVRIAVISLLCAGGEIESRLKRTIQVYDALRKHFFSSQYLPVAAVMIADLVRPEKYDETAARVRHIYDLMKNEHPFLTSGEDSVFAAMLALSPMTDAEIVSETERCFELLKGEFFSSKKRSAVSQPRIGSGRGDAGKEKNAGRR